MIEGLKEMEKKLKEIGIPFHILLGEPDKKMPDFLINYDISLLGFVILL